MTTNHVSLDNGAAIQAGRKSTRQLLDKIPNVPCLYRHSVNGKYYAIKKQGRKHQNTKSFETTDRKTAERKLAAWLKNLGKVDPELEHTTLNQLLDKFKVANVGKPDAGTDNSIITRLTDTWKNDLDIRVSKIKPSHLDEWLAVQCDDGEWRNTTYNKYCTFFRRLFAIAVADKIIAKDDNPMGHIQTPWKKPQKVKRCVPTLDQFAAIVADVRAQKMNADAEDSADFLEFMGNAGLGQAEVNLHAFKWSDVDWERGIFRALRKKTQTPFDVPIYPNLRPLLEKLAAKPHKPHDSVLKIADAKKALAGSCKRLGFMVEKNGESKAMFSQRNIRAVQIRRLWRDKVDVKLISKWQGHQDGGKLILNTYTEVFSTDDDEYMKSELAKIKM